MSSPSSPTAALGPGLDAEAFNRFEAVGLGGGLFGLRAEVANARFWPTSLAPGLTGDAFPLCQDLSLGPLRGRNQRGAALRIRVIGPRRLDALGR